MGEVKRTVRVLQKYPPIFLSFSPPYILFSADLSL